MGDELKGQSGYFEPLEVLKEALYLITINSKWDSVADLLSITQSDDIVTVTHLVSKFPLYSILFD